MKTLIAAALLATAIASPSNAENWFKPDGSGLTPGAQKIIDRGPPVLGSVRSRDLNPPDYVSNSNLTINHGNGTTSTYNSTSRFYFSYSR